MAALGEVLERLLGDRADASVRELVAGVRAAGGHGVSRAEIERVLAADGRFVAVDESGRPRWALAEPATATVTTTTPAGPTAAAARAALDPLQLRAWQAEALAAWSTTCQGVVEAVTGTGKTRLALAVTRAVVDRGGRVLVLAPTVDLVEQWRREVRSLLPDVSVGQLGGGGDDDLHTHQVVIATPHSAAAVEVDLPSGVFGCLIADEAHRYGAPTWAVALRPWFGLRLALTATYERNDDGVAEVLGPYFGPVVMQYGYERAAADGVIAPFEVALVTTALDEVERSQYELHDRRARRARAVLVAAGLPRDPRRLFARVAALVAEADGRDDPTARAGREYLAASRQRRDVAATAAGKLVVLGLLAPGIAAADRSLVFCDTVEQAELAARQLVRHGVAAETVHGQLAADRRRIRLAQFRKGALQVVVAPRVLDEGVDVPEADVAVVLAAFRSRRQMVQRLGRVLRRKPDGRVARLVVVGATDTAEDPDAGAHEAFLADVVGVARRVDRLDADREPDVVAAWLNGGPVP